jgi:hypothetical protein
MPAFEKRTPWPSLAMTKLDAMYWPSSDRLVACEPSLTVNVPPVLPPFAVYPSVVLTPKLMFDRSICPCAPPTGSGVRDPVTGGSTTSVPPVLSFERFHAARV